MRDSADPGMISGRLTDCFSNLSFMAAGKIFFSSLSLLTFPENVV